MIFYSKYSVGDLSVEGTTAEKTVVKEEPVQVGKAVACRFLRRIKGKMMVLQSLSLKQMMTTAILYQDCSFMRHF